MIPIACKISNFSLYLFLGFLGGSGGLDYSFHKNCFKTINLYSITLKLGTDKQHVKANFHTKFCMNLINVQDAVNNYSCEKN